MSLIIEILACKCGFVDTIETDDRAFVEKKKAEFQKKHEKCEDKHGQAGGAARP